MFTTTVKSSQRFHEVGVQIDALCLAALRDAAEAASVAAQAASSIQLEIEIVPASPMVEGFHSAIKSNKRGKRAIRLAPIFDEGTLGRHHGKLKRPRRDHWQVNRAGATTYTAHRGPITPDEGIVAERFFPRARATGRKVLLARLARGV